MVFSTNNIDAPDYNREYDKKNKTHETGKLNGSGQSKFLIVTHIVKEGDGRAENEGSNRKKGDELKEYSDDIRRSYRDKVAVISVE